ncbi:sarcosine oxidase [Haloactinopolyspora alba]|uniref:Sarcosine oxidase n=1 Tax=Haloactinopolyspora alba TaxID=648780 RepID=A0A2P8DY89_9ACTN|nr:sarcosine oxidase [Haloactinopolyspora alba]
MIVVGLGAVGSATTRRLAASGVRVLGVDRYAPPHSHGSSHGETRITREAVGEGAAYVPFVRRSHEVWRELEEESGTRLFHATGGLLISPASGAAAMHGADDFAASTIAVAQRHRIDHRVLGPDELRREFGQFRTGAEHVGYHEPGAGLVLAEEAVRVQLELAVRHGAQLRRDEVVHDVVPDGDGVRIRTDQGEYGADVAVLAAGSWLPELLEPELARLFTVYRQLQTWFRLDGDAAAFDPAGCPVFIWQFGSGEDDVCYGFPAVEGPSGGVKIGTERYADATGPGTVRRTVDDAETAEVYERCVRGRIPALGPGVVRSASCLYTVTPDFGFVVDHHPEHRNVVIAAPCSGHGFKHSAAVGEATAELATTGAATLDLTPFALSRFGFG